MNGIILHGYSAFRETIFWKKTLFDPVRRKSVAATPEESVRQFTLQYLMHEKQFPRSLLGVENSLTVNRLSKRCDIVAYKNNQPVLLVECKAPSVRITQEAFDQIARYNLVLRVPYLLVTNGIISFCCAVDLQNESFVFLENLPEYSDL